LASCASDRQPPTLAVRIDGLTVADVLSLSVRDALERFADRARSPRVDRRSGIRPRCRCRACPAVRDADVPLALPGPARDRLIMHRGPSGGHPEDDEPGHKEGCLRLAALVAEYDARWAEE